MTIFLFHWFARFSRSIRSLGSPGPLGSRLTAHGTPCRGLPARDPRSLMSRKHSRAKQQQNVIFSTKATNSASGRHCCDTCTYYAHTHPYSTTFTPPTSTVEVQAGVPGWSSNPASSRLVACFALAFLGIQMIPSYRTHAAGV